MNPRNTACSLVLMALLLSCGSGGSQEATGDATTLTSEDRVPEDGQNGAELYGKSCASCHGADAAGVEGVGKPLAGANFITDNDTDFLVQFITTGRSTSDPANTTGVFMPPRGGNPSLSDADLRHIVIYLKSLR
ncbi:MAG: cytochrome c [Acidimicrobiales bacterium]|jgi:disulfide bond formation protein DsbB|nr:cytochrome c [Acidimicrobiales bacterium]MDP6901457.1 cytochrome c [Acidimicrobiales bacterium]